MVYISHLVLGFKIWQQLYTRRCISHIWSLASRSCSNFIPCGVCLTFGPWLQDLAVTLYQVLCVSLLAPGFKIWQQLYTRWRVSHFWPLASRSGSNFLPGAVCLTFGLWLQDLAAALYQVACVSLLAPGFKIWQQLYTRWCEWYFWSLASRSSSNFIPGSVCLTFGPWLQDLAATLYKVVPLTFGPWLQDLAATLYQVVCISLLAPGFKIWQQLYTRWCVSHFWPLASRSGSNFILYGVYRFKIWQQL